MPGGIVPAVITGGLGLAGAAIGSSSADKAADAQEKAANKAANIQYKMYQQTRQDLQPYARSGIPAMRSVMSMYGLTPGSQAFNDRAMADFRAAPDYQIAYREGLRALDNTAAARGELKSGATYKAAMGYASDLGTSKLDEYMDRLLRVAGMGQNAAAGQGSAAMSTGRGLASSYMDAGQAAASGAVASGNIWGGALSNLGNNLAFAMERNPSAYRNLASIY